MTDPQPQPIPHPVIEDPEDHIGDVTPDPWDDPAQTDWPDRGTR